MRYCVIACVLAVWTVAGEARESADLVLHGGRVLTLDDAGKVASAVAIRDGRIVAVGDESLVARFDARTREDLAGRTLMPGFVDSHTHIEGRAKRHVDLTKVTSLEALLAAVGERAAALGPGEWITGYGWSEDQLDERRRPLVGDLDRAAPANPVILTRAGGHSAVCNSRALALAGIDTSTPDPENGFIEHDADGRPNGIIRERQDVVARLVPEAPAAEL